MFIKILFTTLCIIFILSSCSNEPDPISTIPTPKATVKGIVRDTDTNEPIYYAMISTFPPTKEIYTGIDGTFVLEDISPREYVVYSYQQGYDDDSVSISLTVGDTAVVDLHLNNFEEYLDYYPLEIGNYWEYWNGVSPTYSIEIVSDTIINNILYFVSVYKNLHIGNYDEIRYERIDSYNALAYRISPYAEDEAIIDSLPAKAGQFFINRMMMDWDGLAYCWSIEIEEIFGKARSVRTLGYLGHHLPSYKIAKGIGLFTFSFGRILNEHILKYAIINGVEYGEK